MKLIRIGPPGQEIPGVLSDRDGPLDVSAFGEDYNETFFATDGPARLREWLATQGKLPRFPGMLRYGPPIARPSKIICVGLNYADHAKESGVSLPEEPVLFFKSTSALCGANDPVIIPQDSLKTDWEVELAFVIGKVARRVPEADAMQHVAGYVLHNDYSEREWQLERCGQWVKGKSADSFAPLGPWLVTPDEIADPQNLDLWLKVNGGLLQNSSTRQMAFGVATLLSYISRFMTLLPGDVVSTGTPPGVGLGMKPPRYLKAGDVVELGITGLGGQRQVACAETFQPSTRISNP
ncbi:fumarylacetoacetate hydrolase family protein [Prosthecobacter sp.]|uniref:fumarylacetoacetate hydrolase family protein n=1 Tax=Prosthecobacter sp. TaxID=1965333 RepID=UPI0037842A3A